MPANLTPQFHEAENKYRMAKDNKEKLMYLEEMLKVIPKHKGTEKIQGDIKSRIAKLKKEPDTPSIRFYIYNKTIQSIRWSHEDNKMAKCGFALVAALDQCFCGRTCRP